jgi:hypothetical protein
VDPEIPLFSKTWNVRTSRLAFLRAVFVVRDEFAAEGRKPSSTLWSTHQGYMGKHSLPRIRAEWARFTGLDESLFPWTDDEVGTTWEEWRKTNAKYRADFRRQLGLPENAGDVEEGEEINSNGDAP